MTAKLDRERLRLLLLENAPVPGPVMVYFGHDQKQFAFAMNLSPRALTMIHSEPLDAPFAVIEVRLPTCRISLATELEWHKPFANGWWESSRKIVFGQNQEMEAGANTPVGEAVRDSKAQCPLC